MAHSQPNWRIFIIFFINLTPKIHNHCDKVDYEEKKVSWGFNKKKAHKMFSSCQFRFLNSRHMCQRRLAFWLMKQFYFCAIWCVPLILMINIHQSGSNFEHFLEETLMILLTNSFTKWEIISKRYFASDWIEKFGLVTLINLGT